MANMSGAKVGGMGQAGNTKKLVFWGRCYQKVELFGQK